MSWIKEIPYDAADRPLKKLYDRVKGPDNNVDNVLSVHSLRPHTLLGHMTLYKNVLHNANNTLPKWYLETLGVYVSQLNQCDYCVAHHYAGLQRLLKNDRLSAEIKTAIRKDNLAKLPPAQFDQKHRLGLAYAKQLTFRPASISEAIIEELRTAGLDDGEILEINQVVSYFNYVNRSVLGLGVNTKGDVLGLSPNDSSNPDDWSHG
ncbi:MAG: peroxidase-related enzyme [Bacteroidota bacterium]